jgi:endonuclease/exonuclease/phosphatase family metal-dependent hydrolase
LRACELLGEISYPAAAKAEIVRLMTELGLETSDTGPYVILRRNRGGLLRRPRAGGIEVIADGRADWVGSLELRDAPIDERAMRNTARVLIDVKADVQAVVEAESRPALAAFNAEIVTALGGQAFRHVMLIDGNDARGIDVGLITREGFPIEMMPSHVDDWLRDGEPVFSRDCPEFLIATPSGERLFVLVNHFKSKGYGSASDSDARRRAQALRVKEICTSLLANGVPHIAVVGDLNDTPDSAPLAPLLADGVMRDVFTHPAFDDGGYPGTYGLCNADNKIDYLLLSPLLYDRVQAGGVFRKGMWPGSRPPRWPVYEEIEEPVHAGSDHAAVWVDIDL